MVTSSKLAALCFAGCSGMAVRGSFSRFGFRAGLLPPVMLVMPALVISGFVMSGNSRHRRTRQIRVQGFLLLREVLPLAGQQQVEVDLVPVKLRSVDADELRLAADAAPAGTTHAGTVHHDRVEADECLDAIRLGGLGAELHHDAWADGVDKVDVAGFAELLERLGDQAVAAAAAVVRGDDKLVTDLPHPVLPQQQPLVTGSDDPDHLVASFSERPRDGVDRRNADAAAGADDRAHLLDLARYAPRNDEVGQRVARAQLP